MTDEELKAIRQALEKAPSGGAVAVYETDALYRALEEMERLREIVRVVAAIKVTGGVDRNLPYDAQISAWTVHKARALLGMENK